MYPYEAQREQDAGFAENLLIIAHPAKDKTSDWLYGMVVATGSKGWLPKTYVEELREPHLRPLIVAVIPADS